MPITLRPTRCSCTAALTVSLVLAGCGGTDAPTATTINATSSETTPVVTQSASTPGSGVPITPDLVTAEPSVASAPVERSAIRDQAKLDEAAAQVQHNVEPTTDAVTQGARDFKAGVNQAVGSVQTQAKQAASDAADGVQGFAAELRTEASQTVTDTIKEVKGGVTDSLNDAKSSVQGQVQSAVAGAKGKVRSSVEDARAAALRKAKAASDEVRKSAQKETQDLLNGLSNTAPKQ